MKYARTQFQFVFWNHPENLKELPALIQFVRRESVFIITTDRAEELKDELDEMQILYEIVDNKIGTNDVNIMVFRSEARDTVTSSHFAEVMMERIVEQSA